MSQDTPSSPPLREPPASSAGPSHPLSDPQMRRNEIATKLADLLAAHREGYDGSDCSDINDPGSCERCDTLDAAIKALSSADVHAVQPSDPPAPAAVPDDVARLRAVLKQCREYLDDRADVIDGEDGPRPDAAMSLLTDVDAALASSGAASISSTWLPTPANVNALPEQLRHYIHQLETNCDPAGDQAMLIIERDRVRQLSAALAEASGAASPASPWQPISTAPERRGVFVSWLNALGKRRMTKAAYFPAGTLDMSDDVPEDDRDEEGHNLEAGWFEDREAGDGEYYPLNEALTHWMPLPDPPAASVGDPQKGTE